MRCVVREGKGREVAGAVGVDLAWIGGVGRVAEDGGRVGGVEG